jgi:uncharacterized membrane protein
MSEDQIPNEQEEASSDGKAGLVFLSLFILTLVGVLIAMPFSDKVEEVATFLSSDDKYLAVFGNMHPLVLHLPIGIVFLTLVMEVFGWISFGRYRPVTTMALFFAVLTGALACFTGYVEVITDGYSMAKWNNHMWAGIAFVGVLGLALLSRVWGGRKGGRNPVYAILLLISAGVMGFGAHLGGEEIHGDPLAPLGLGAKVKPDNDGGVSKEPKDRLAYAEVVASILESKCLACHAVDTKKKGGLLMDSWEGLLAGGDEGPSVVPGDTKESLLLYRIHLPIDDEDEEHMPPPKKDQLEEHEIAILDWWVAALPKSETLEDKTLEEMGASAEIIEAASKLVSPEELKAMADALAEEVRLVEEAKKAKREALDAALGELKQDAQLKTAINYVSQDSSDLEFTAISLRESMTDDHFAKLGSVCESLVSLQLGSTSVTEGALEAHLPKMSNLRKLNLSQTSITDKGLDAVAQLSNLEWLNLYETGVTDAGLAKLKGLTNLKKVYLWNSKATPEGGKALMKELPNLEVIFGIQ